MKENTSKQEWVPVDSRLPEEWTWVVHTYAGVRKPEYGLFKEGRFWREYGVESFPTTHWLPVPVIDLSNVPDHLLPLAFGSKACSAGDVPKVPKAWELGASVR